MKPLTIAMLPLLTALLAACGGGGGTPAPVLALSVTGLPAGNTLAAATTYALSATETSNGQPLSPGTLTCTLDTPAVGTLGGATLVTGELNASGHITCTDTSRGLSATVAVTVASTHPATAGDNVTFAGTLAEQIIRATQPAYNISYSVSISSTTSTGKTFAGKTGLNDFTTVETDTGATPPLPVTTTDTFEHFLALPGGVDVVSYGTQASDSNGSTYATTLGSGNGLLDVLPETNGRTWVNGAAETYAEAEPDSTKIARTINADGSYTETDTFADPSLPAATIAVNADLSGSYANAFGYLSLTFGTPLAGAGGSTIPFTATVSGGAPQAGVIADWYPTTSLYTDSVKQLTAQPIPSACKVPASVGASATEISEAMTRLDPVLGTYETRTDLTYFAPAYGTVCTVLADRLEDYYDYSGQSATILHAVSQQNTTLSETLGFESGTIAGAAVAHAAAVRQQSASPAQTRVAIAVGRASFSRAVERLYHERRLALHALLQHPSSLHWTGR